MTKHEPEAWGGEVHVPRWVRKIMHRAESPGDSDEKAQEPRSPEKQASVTENADRAAMGALTQLYAEGKRRKP